MLMWRWKKPPVDPKIHRVDIVYDISLNVEYVHTFGIRLPNIRGKYWREEFKNFYRESRLYLAPSQTPPPPPPFQGKKVNKPPAPLPSPNYSSLINDGLY